MKRLVTDMFTSLLTNNKITLKPSKKDALIDFLSVVPEIVTNAAKRSYILKGFLVPGMVDRKFNRYPDFNTLLSTCRRNPSEQEYEHCYRSFSPLFTKFQQDGHITDRYLQELGFPVDVDSYGREVHRTATIAQEYMQRCKCLTHPVQKHLREQRMADIAKSMSDKRRAKNDTINRVLEESDGVVSKICTMMGVDTHIDSLSSATLDHFVKVGAKSLESFILTRNQHYLTKSKLPKKGTLIEATEGAITLVSIAFACRTSNHYGKYLQVSRGDLVGEAAPVADRDETPNAITMYTV